MGPEQVLIHVLGLQIYIETIIPLLKVHQENDTLEHVSDMFQ